MAVFETLTPVGFADVDVRTVVSDQTTPGGAPVKRHSIRMRAHA